MGILEQVIGGVVGAKAGGSGMSPLTKALLLMLAAKAASSHFGGSGQKPGAATAGNAPPAPPSGRIESGVLAGLPNLDSILSRFRTSGHEDKVESWIGTGPNKTIAPHELEQTLGPDAIRQLEAESGLPRDQLMKQLAEAFPKVVDKLTPDGRLPPASERTRW